MRLSYVGFCCWIVLAGMACGQDGADLAPGELQTFTNLKIAFCWCPPGSFKMGSPTTEADRSTNENQTDVTLSHGFWMQQHEVTQGLWKSVMNSEPWVEDGDEDYYRSGPEYPAVCVWWDDALEFCKRLTTAERSAGRLAAEEQYTLPTEAQWEYACRAGTKTTYSFGNDASQLGDYAWYDANARDIGEKYAHIIGQKRANPWKLHDMHGNVCEMCQDLYEDTLPGGRDPLVQSSKGADRANRVSRGGSWNFNPARVRSAYRSRSTSDYGYFFLGFRLARSSVQ